MKRNEDYIEALKKIDIDEKDFDYIEESLSELDKERIKMNLNKSIKNQKQKSKKIKYVTVAAILLITLGATSVPTIAKNIPFISYIYDKVGYGDRYSNYTTGIGQTIEYDGVKVTIDDIVGTKYKVAITAKIEAVAEADREKLDKVLIGCGFVDSTGYSAYSPRMRKVKGENGELLVLSESSCLSSNMEKGNLKIAIDFDDRYSKTIDYAADFSKASQDAEEININKKIEQFGVTISKIESDVLSTNLLIKGDFSQEKDIFNSSDNRIMLKVGDYFYRTTGRSGDKEEIAFEFPKEAYEKMKEESNSSIIPIVSSAENEYIDTIIDDDKGEYLKEGNVEYYKELEFRDGSKVEISKLEITEDIVRVHYKGETEKHSLLIGSGMWLGDVTSKQNKTTWGGYAPVIYKEKNQEGAYIAEFNNVDTSTKLKLGIIPSYGDVNGVEIGEEIKID